MTEDHAYNLFNWTDEQVIHFIESAGLGSFVADNVLGRQLDVDDDAFEVWKHPELAAVRKAVAEAYLFGIHISNLSCKRWHEHCRNAEHTMKG